MPCVCAQLVARWWALGDELTTIFRDGMQLQVRLNTAFGLRWVSWMPLTHVDVCCSCVQSSHPPLELQHLFYPVWWLKEVGYFTRGPLSNPTYPALPAHMRPTATPVSAVAQTAASETPAAIKDDLVMAFPHIHSPVATTKLVHHGREQERKVHQEAEMTDQDQVDQSERGHQAGLAAQKKQPQQQQQQQQQHVPQPETKPKRGQERSGPSDVGSDSKGHRPPHSHASSAEVDPSSESASFGSWVRSQRTLAIGLFLLVIVLISILFFQLGKMCARRGGYQAVGEEEPRSYDAAAQKKVGSTR